MARTERSGHTTTDHDFIRQWVEDRGGWPARVTGTSNDDEDPGLIRIDFPGFSGEGSLERIEWDEWFQGFEENQLAFLHRDMDHGGGDLDRFNKLVRRGDDDDQVEEPRGGRRGRSAVASSARKTSSARGGSSSAKSTSSRSGSSSRGGASERSTSGSKSGSSRKSSAAGGGTSARKSSSGTKSSSGSKSTSSAKSSASKSASSSKSSGSKSSSSKSSGSKSSGSKSSGSKSSGARTASARGNGPSSSTSRSSSRAADTGAAAKSSRSGGAQMTELRDLLLHELGDLLSAERQFLVATRALVREAMDPEVKARCEEHVTETEGQIERVRQAFAAIGERPRAETCEAAMGLKEEHDSFKNEEKPSRLILSAFDLGSGLRVEHYEIAAYRSAIAVASALGEKECANLLKESLKEEMAMASFLEKNSLAVLKRAAAEA